MGASADDVSALSTRDG
jgi:hypothetical protein